MVAIIEGMPTCRDQEFEFVRHGRFLSRKQIFLQSFGDAAVSAVGVDGFAAVRSKVPFLMVDLRALVAFGRLDWERKLLLLETAACLSAAGLAVRFLPFRRAILVGTLPLRGQPPSDRVMLIRDVQRNVSSISKRVLWRSVCLQQALAAQMVLRRRGVDARLHYGVANDREGLRAHAWVTADHHDVVGGLEAAAFRKVATFPTGADKA